MHIAICDENIADRKQTERLLRRESDARSATTGVLYIDSYGQQGSLLHAPKLYDMFFIDMAESGAKVCQDTVAALIAADITCPIVLLISKIDYRQFSFPKNVLFMDKPLRVSELSEMIGFGLAEKEKAIPKIELRDDIDAIYVESGAIISVAMHGLLYSDVLLTDGRIVRILCTPENFLAQVERFETFFMPNSKTVLNKKYVEKHTFFHVTLTNGTSYPIHIDFRKSVKTILSQ